MVVKAFVAIMEYSDVKYVEICKSIDGHYQERLLNKFSTRLALHDIQEIVSHTNHKILEIDYDQRLFIIVGSINQNAKYFIRGA
jgi:hypothetical protein